MSSKHVRISPSSSLSAGTLSNIGTFAWPSIAEYLDVDGWAILGNTCRGLRRTVMDVQQRTRHLRVVLAVDPNGEDVSLIRTGKWWRLFNGFNAQDMHTTKDLILRLRSSLTTLRIDLDDEGFDDNDIKVEGHDAERWCMIHVALTTLAQAPALLEFNLGRCLTMEWLGDAKYPRDWLRDAMQQLILASGASCRLQRLILNPCFNRTILPPVTWKAQVGSSLRSVTCSIDWLESLTKSPAPIRHHITSICLDDDFTGTSLARALALCNVETFPALRRLHFALPAFECMDFENETAAFSISNDRLHEFPSYANLPNLYAEHIGRFLTWPGLEWFCFQPTAYSAFRWDAQRRRLDIYARDHQMRLDSVQANWLGWCRKDLPPHELCLVVDVSSIEMAREQQMVDHIWITNYWYDDLPPTQIMAGVKSLIVGPNTSFEPDKDLEITEEVSWDILHSLDADHVAYLSTCFPNVTSMTLSMADADVFRRLPRRWTESEKRSNDDRLKLHAAMQRLRSLEHFSIVIGTATVWSAHKRSEWTWSSSIRVPMHLVIDDDSRVCFEKVVDDWKTLLAG
jgi:hypothetical protein